MHNLPSDIIIVIGRQFGSGGRHIGKRLAEDLNLRYYDKEVLSECASRLGFRREIFDRYDEKRPSMFRSLLANAFGDSCVNCDLSGDLYRAQSRVIRELADADRGAVFVGRSADYILRDFPHLVSIFLHAPLRHRAMSIVKRGDSSSVTEAMESARRQDRNREEFYNFFTNRNWGQADNYHLSIDSSLFDSEAIVDIIKCYLTSRHFD